MAVLAWRGLSVLLFKLMMALEIHKVFVDSSFLNETLCPNHAEDIKHAILEDYTQFRPFGRRYCVGSIGALNEVLVEETYAFDLPLKCVEVFRGVPEMMAVVVVHRVQRLSVFIGSPEADLRLALRDIDRNDAFMPIVDHLLSINVALLRRGVDAVSFEGEAGTGPGVVRDWFSTAARQVFGDDVGLFKQRRSEIPFYLTLNPSIDSSDVERLLHVSRAVGRLLGLCLVSGIALGLDFPASCFARLLGQNLTLEDVVHDEPALHAALGWILEASSVEEMGVDWIEIYGTEVRLTMGNRKTLVMLKVNSLIPKDSLDFMMAIQYGLFDVVPWGLLADLNPKTLRLMIRGRPTVDWLELRRIARYVAPLHDGHELVEWFWKILDEKFSQERAEIFLFYISSSTTVPVGGFVMFGSEFRMVPIADVHRFPVSHTCSFTIDLPLYTSKAVLEDRLIRAVDEALVGMHLI